MKQILSLVYLLSLAAHGQTLHTVLPKDTDPAITVFNDKGNCCFYPEKPNGKLVVYFPGSNAKPSQGNLFLKVAAELGYHAVALYYPNVTKGQSEFKNQTPEEGVNNYWYEVIFGEDKTKIVDIDYANSIENRLIKCLQWLDKNFPQEGWAQFLDKNSIPYEKLVLSGHSRGGNVATIYGKFRKFDRIISLSIAPPAEAGYLWDSPATPMDRFYFFWHKLDKGAQKYEGAKAMGIKEPMINIDTTPEEKWGHMLETTYPCDRAIVHPITVNDGITPVKDGVPVFKDVWVHLLINPAR